MFKFNSSVPFTANKCICSILLFKSVSSFSWYNNVIIIDILLLLEAFMPIILMGWCVFH